ncbi:MAG: NifB/NifX family molybdenum-iron cluster-binding protein [Deltaproteobacteria bacterium]|nr:NifB/NifX family molybdenum-iron cluster-binding protein [Deltaproteobacteria bacterium]
MNKRRITKVAVSIWDGRISPVFDVCRKVAIYDIENQNIIAHTNVSIVPNNTYLKIQKLIALGVDTIICGAISEALYQQLYDHGIIIYGFIAGDINQVINAFLNNTLNTPSLSMPGCCQNRYRMRAFLNRRGGNKTRCQNRIQRRGKN